MIRVYSGNFDKWDLLFIAAALKHNNACAVSFGSAPCYECDRVKACLALNKAAEYCEKKAFQK